MNTSSAAKKISPAFGNTSETIQQTGKWMIVAPCLTLQQVIHGILKYLNARGQALGRLFSATSEHLFLRIQSGWLVQWLYPSGWGISPKDAAGGITNPGNILQGPIGIEGEFPPGDFTVVTGVLQDDLIVFKQPVNCFIVGNEFAFPMPDRELEFIQTARKNAGRRRHGLHLDPCVPEIAAVVVGQGHGLPQTFRARAPSHRIQATVPC